MTTFITRKDLAALLKVSVETVRLNEKRRGLDKARRDLNSRVIRYDLDQVFAILKKTK